MDETTVWAVVIGLGLASALIRYSFLGLLAGREVPGWLRKALSFVPVAAFPAIFMPMVMFGPEGGWAPLWQPLAAGIALAVGLATRSILGALAAGALAVVALQIL
ncbi:MAG: AzlD domain-containing protein [Pseudomonadota bacterium]